MSFPDIIILAGGKGTRLQSVVNDVPKPMAPIISKPFLWYLLNFLKRGGANRIVLAVGYKKESIFDFFGDEFLGMELVYVVEDEPLGTGGAIAKAMSYCQTDNVLVYNGDTFFDAAPKLLLDFHLDHKAALSLFLKPILNPDRYGTVTFTDNIISEFKEKQEGLASGLINAGIYCINRAKLRLPERPIFSFENEVLEPYATQKALFGLINDAYFIDIGIPDDYKKANDTFGEMGY
jgi:D-glycero-alpha-D-manno-heptose 1-phosphate guanylyltransferase